MKIATKLSLEFLPLILFLIFTFTNDVYVGTMWLMGTTVLATALVWYLYRQVALMALINAATGLAAGAMTLYWTDPDFVRMKPTVISLIYAAILFIGLIVKRPLLKTLLGEDLHLTEQGWSVITRYCALYFAFIAVVNEAIWRNFSIEFWAGFKVFGLIPLSLLFAVALVPIARRFRTLDAPEDSTVDSIADYLDGGASRKHWAEQKAASSRPAEAGKRIAKPVATPQRQGS